MEDRDFTEIQRPPERIKDPKVLGRLFDLFENAMFNQRRSYMAIFLNTVAQTNLPLAFEKARELAISSEGWIAEGALYCLPVFLAGNSTWINDNLHRLAHDQRIGGYQLLHAYQIDQMTDLELRQLDPDYMRCCIVAQQHFINNPQGRRLISAWIDLDPFAVGEVVREHSESEDIDERGFALELLIDLLIHADNFGEAYTSIRNIIKRHLNEDLAGKNHTFDHSSIGRTLGRLIQARPFYAQDFVRSETLDAEFAKSYPKASSVLFDSHRKIISAAALYIYDTDQIVGAKIIEQVFRAEENLPNDERKMTEALQKYLNETYEDSMSSVLSQILDYDFSGKCFELVEIFWKLYQEKPNLLRGVFLAKLLPGIMAKQKGFAQMIYNQLMQADDPNVRAEAIKLVASRFVDKEDEREFLRLKKIVEDGDETNAVCVTEAALVMLKAHRAHPKTCEALLEKILSGKLPSFSIVSLESVLPFIVRDYPQEQVSRLIDQIEYLWYPKMYLKLGKCFRMGYDERLIELVRKKLEAKDFQGCYLIDALFDIDPIRASDLFLETSDLFKGDTYDSRRVDSLFLAFAKKCDFTDFWPEGLPRGEVKVPKRRRG